MSGELLKSVHREQCLILGLESVRNRLDWDFLGQYLFCMFIQGSLFFLCTVGIQSKFWKKLLSAKKLRLEAEDEEEFESDEDVIKERVRVLNSEPGDDVLQVRNLFKRLIS